MIGEVRNGGLDKPHAGPSVEVKKDRAAQLDSSVREEIRQAACLG